MTTVQRAALFAERVVGRVGYALREVIDRAALKEFGEFALRVGSWQSVVEF
jgi:hypothetical protein